jgi:hypothetical protein
MTNDALGNGSGQRRERTWHWLDHVGLSIATVLGSLVTIQLLGAAAEWNTTTALVILQALGTAELVVGALLVYSPFFLAVTAAIALAVVPYQAILDRRRSWWSWTSWFWVTGVVLLYLVTPVGLIVFSIIVAVAGLGVAAIERGTPGITRMALLGLLAWTAILPLFGGGVIWLPPEAVKIAGEPVPITAFVLEDDGETSTLLLHHPRQARLLPSREVESRQICYWPQSWWQLRPLELFDIDVPNEPVCPGGSSRPLR